MDEDYSLLHYETDSGWPLCGEAAKGRHVMTEDWERVECGICKYSRNSCKHEYAIGHCGACGAEGRWCRICGAELELGDDAVCGWHSLE